MKISHNEIAILVMGGIAAVTVAYMANANSGGQQLVPLAQTKEDVMGLGAQATLLTGPGEPLSVDIKYHGWHPGYDPDTSSQPVSSSKHGYPAVPGGNLSYVLHHGWSQFCNASPDDNDWRIAPPEAAII